MNIKAEDVKKIRDRTGASIALIKKALTDANGDEDKAMKVLEDLGADLANKKQSRDTRAGIVEAYLHHDKRVGVLLEMRTETDFVARNEAFYTLAHDIAMHIAAMKPKDAEELIDQAFIKDESQKISDLIKSASAKFGEHIEIGQFVRYEL
ncbi:elongation factor Ts [Patescibacteria group bacterium]